MGRMAGPLWCVETGDGPPLVLLHGNGESHRVFDRMVAPLAPRHRLVALDSRGHGATPRGEAPLTIARMADDVDGALAELGLTGVDVLGFSDGGNVALELALRHPRRTGRLVVVGANLSPEGLTARTLAEVRVVHAALQAAGRVVPAARRAAERWALMADQPRIDPSDLRRVAVPTLVVVGARDVVRPEHTRLIADRLPLARVAVVPRAGHMLPLTHPRELAALVEAFLEP